MRGAFITLEGIEGVGKSTHRDRCKAYLEERGLSVVVTREPGGTELGERIRSWILDGEHDDLSPEVETLLMFAARGYHIDTVIRPALDNGHWVLCDRFTDATFAYQGAGRGVGADLLLPLKAAIQRDLEADLTLLFDAPIEIGFQRIADRSKDHFEREDRAFFVRVREGYAGLAHTHSERYRVIDAAKPIEEVWAATVAQLDQFIERFGRRK
jgi:dTMP kinase